MRSSFRLPFAKWLAPPFGGAIVFVAGSSVALATTLTAGAVVRVPDNPLGETQRARLWSHGRPHLAAQTSLTPRSSHMSPSIPSTRST
jgi:hypothetical protein